jgi:hypothetical protein
MKTDMPRRDPRTGRFEKSKNGDEKTAADRSDEIEHDLYGTDDDILPPGDPVLIGTEYGPRPASEDPLSAARGCLIGMFLVGCLLLAIVVIVWARSAH